MDMKDRQLQIVQILKDAYFNWMYDFHPADETGSKVR